MKAVIASVAAVIASCGAGEATTDLFSSLGETETFAQKLSSGFRGESKITTLPGTGRDIVRRTYNVDQKLYVLDVTTEAGGPISQVEIAFPLKNEVCQGVPPIDDLAKLQLAATEPELASDIKNVNLLTSLLRMSWRHPNSGMPSVKVGRTNYWFSRSQYFCSVKMSRSASEHSQ